MMATYLPYCDLFISNDSKQLKFLEAVAVECGFDVAVRSCVKLAVAGLHLFKTQSLTLASLLFLFCSRY